MTTYSVTPVLGSLKSFCGFFFGKSGNVDVLPGSCAVTVNREFPENKQDIIEIY
jgi:hypothetical protein